MEDVVLKPDWKYEVTAAVPGRTERGRTGAGAAGLRVGASVA